MVHTVKKRSANPLIVQQLWKAIAHVRQSKQIPNRERVIGFMKRTHGFTEADAETELIRALKDGLIIAYTAVGSKGSKVGLQQEGYKNPEIDPEWSKGSSDWYCFECHKPGDIVECNNCWRVYHEGCISDDREEDEPDTFLCVYCQASKRHGRMKRKQLNRLLSFVIVRLKEKAKELHRLLQKESELQLDRLVYRHMDLNTMEAKTNERKYKYLEQFQADAQNIIHNIIICYGAASGMATLATVMIRDCKYDLEEIHHCQDCYYYSNAKPKDWFCQPCRPPHELVFAKQKGYSYWPAKVIKISPQGYDVRFFGGRHERATVPHNYIQSLDADIKDFRKTAAFNKSMEELRRHQALNKQMSEQQAQEGSEPEHSNEEMEEDERQQPEVQHKKRSFVRTRQEIDDMMDEDEQPPPKKRKKPGRKSLKDKMKDTPIKEASKPAEEAEEERISSSNMLKDEKVCSPDDNHQVTSSVDNVQVPKIVTSINASTQTSKKFGQGQKMPSHATQTDTELSTKNCDCESKYNEVFRSFKERMETDHQKDQEKALQELSEKMQKDFEEDKQQAVARAMSKMSQELERVRRQTEEACKSQYMDEMKTLAQKHKEQISSVKKKQWCFNCEEEAMYHCCWNTSYCSIKCQQEHWHKEHKRVCRRKR